MDVAIVSPGLDRTVLDDKDACIVRTQVANRVHRRMKTLAAGNQINRQSSLNTTLAQPRSPPRAKETSFLLL